MPSTPFAHMLGAGRTEHPPSLSICKKAPLPGLLPPSLRATCCVCALPHPLLECGGRDRRDSAHPPFHLPLCLSYATPIPWVMMCLASPHLAPPTPLPLCTHAGEAQGMVSPLPVHGSPLHLCHTSCLGAPPCPHALLCACQKCRRDGDTHKGRTMQRVPHTRRAHSRGGLCAMGPCVRGHMSVEDHMQGDHA